MRWTHDGQRFVHTDDRVDRDSSANCSSSTARLIADLEVRARQLEDTYMALVRAFESGAAAEPVRSLQEVTR